MVSRQRRFAHPIRTLAALLWAVGALSFGTCQVPAQGARPFLDVGKALETPRFITRADGQAIFTSPDGARYVLLLVEASIATNDIAVRVLVGETRTLRAAIPREVAALRTSGLGANMEGEHDLSHLTAPGENPPVWIDADTIALLWQDVNEIVQVISIELKTGRRTDLTAHSSSVRTFSIAAGESIIYGARQPAAHEASDKLWLSGFAVTAPDALGLFNGSAEPVPYLNRRSNTSYFIKQRLENSARAIRLDGLDTLEGEIVFAPKVSPDGRWAIIELTPAEIPESWRQYSDPFVQRLLLERIANPSGLIARNLRRLAIVNLANGHARWLLDAPSIAGQSIDLAWTEDSHSLALKSFYGPSARYPHRQVAAGVIDVRTGAVEAFDLPQAYADRVDSVSVDGAAIVVSTTEGKQIRFTKSGSRWKRNGTPRIATLTPTLALTIRQGLNEPPALYATASGSHKPTLLLDPTPELRGELAPAKAMTWQTALGHSVSGTLYYPAHYDASERYPLVIQTHPPALDQFSLYGPNFFPTAGPGWAGYLARPLAQAGYFVLNVATTQRPVSVENIDEVVESYASAARGLIAQGLVRCDAIGLIGWSSSGWRVEYAITHSDFPFAAAVAIDNKDGGYIQAAFSDWPSGASEDLNGAPPFGAGLHQWMAHSPPMRADRATAPLLLITSDNYAGLATPAAMHWEMFSRMRRANKPVELYVIPHLNRGHHALQNPEQVLALQQRVFDWWEFWLRGRETTDRARSGQYQAWRALHADFLRGDARHNIAKDCAWPE